MWRKSGETAWKQINMNRDEYVRRFQKATGADHELAAAVVNKFLKNGLIPRWVTTNTSTTDLLNPSN